MNNHDKGIPLDETGDCLVFGPGTYPGKVKTLFVGHVSNMHTLAWIVHLNPAKSL